MVNIPRALLPHTAQLSPLTGSDAWSNESYGDPVALSFVRVEPSSRIVRDKDNTERQLSAMLYYDCKNSLPAGLEFSEGSKVSFRGREYDVSVVEPIFADSDEPHHYELGLM